MPTKIYIAKLAQSTTKESVKKYDVILIGI
jgi:hypothetical protein